jgi:hypothetical protein
MHRYKCSWSDSANMMVGDTTTIEGGYDTTLGHDEEPHHCL